jgi:IMP cyclohydrolase
MPLTRTKGTLHDYLLARPYPGRGIVLSRPRLNLLSVSTFISGRSPESRARHVARVGSGWHVRPTNADGEDDPLRHYSTIEATGHMLVAGNGRHVTTIAEAERGPVPSTEPFFEMDYEPDPPINTPRIAMALTTEPRSEWAIFGIAARGSDGDTRHTVEKVGSLDEGLALVVHTYDGDPETPKADGYSALVEIDRDSGDAPTDAIWESLDQRFRVAVATAAVSSGEDWAHADWYARQTSESSS